LVKLLHLTTGKWHKTVAKYMHKFIVWQCKTFGL